MKDRYSIQCVWLAGTGLNGFESFNRQLRAYVPSRQPFRRSELPYRHEFLHVFWEARTPAADG